MSDLDLARLLQLIVLEEVDQVSLVGLEGLMGRELVHPKLLHDLKYVGLLIELSSGVSEEKVFAFALPFEATGATWAPHQPESQILVREDLSRFNFFPYWVTTLISYILVCAILVQQ